MSLAKVFEQFQIAGVLSALAFFLSIILKVFFEMPFLYDLYVHCRVFIILQSLLFWGIAIYLMETKGIRIHKKH